ncbi:MAG: RNA polymerase sigma factor [Verrucomicrobiota bacterium]
MERLRNWRDDGAWAQFMARYGRLVRHVATQAGLRPDEAEDVVQETVSSVARKMPEFDYDRDRCSLEGWVRHVTQLRIKDQLRRRLPVAGAGPEAVQANTDGVGTAWLNSLPDPRQDSRRDAAWDAAWRQNVMERALDRIQLKVSPAHYQLFCLSVVDGRPGPEVARTLGVSLASVYVIRHRVLRLLRAEIEQMRATPGGLG